MKELIRKAILAGLLIGLAAGIYTECENKIVGSFLFSIGLIAVILFEAKLYTGVIGYVNNKKLLLESLIILGFNCLVAFLVGLIFRLVNGTYTVMLQREASSWYELLFEGIGTGMLIYIAVELYKKSKNLLPVVLAVMAFILSGMQHSIANCAYFGMCEITLQGFVGIVVVIIGNTIGSLLIRFLQVGFKGIKYENFKNR